MNDLSKDSIQHICSFIDFSEVYIFLNANNLRLYDLDHIEFIDKINLYKKLVYCYDDPKMFFKDLYPLVRKYAVDNYVFSHFVSCLPDLLISKYLIDEIFDTVIRVSSHLNKKNNDIGHKMINSKCNVDFLKLILLKNVYQDINNEKFIDLKAVEKSKGNNSRYHILRIRTIDDLWGINKKSDKRRYYKYMIINMINSRYSKYNEYGELNYNHLDCIHFKPEHKYYKDDYCETNELNTITCYLKKSLFDYIYNRKLNYLLKV